MTITPFHINIPTLQPDQFVFKWHSLKRGKFSKRKVLFWNQNPFMTSIILNLYSTLSILLPIVLDKFSFKPLWFILITQVVLVFNSCGLFCGCGFWMWLLGKKTLKEKKKNRIWWYIDSMLFPFINRICWRHQFRSQSFDVGRNGSVDVATLRENRRGLFQ